MYTRISWHRINNDINGNPRYVCDFYALLTPAEQDSSALSISEKYKIAVKRSHKIGGRKFHNKQYGGGIVFQSYNNDDLENHIRRIVSQA